MTGYRNTPETFWSRVDRSRGPDACWLWTGRRVGDGYGQIGWRGGYIGSHRLAWTLTHGDPGEMHVLHRCDNPPCCNPAHLFLGTNADNVADKVAKHRHRIFQERGASRHSARLDDAKVMEIRRRAAKGTPHARLAAEYGVSRPNISQIVRGDRWAHLPLVPPEEVVDLASAGRLRRPKRAIGHVSKESP